jgi:hypothetical protein
MNSQDVMYYDPRHLCDQNVNKKVNMNTVRLITRFFKPTYNTIKTTTRLATYMYFNLMRA